jgi:UDP:flavonoid glycosyltransferase YjiC (YdhE family)
MMRKVLNQARADALDLPPMPFIGPLAATLRPDLHLYGFSPQVVPRPADWGANHQIVGFWFLDEAHYRPTAGLLEFLAAGPPPVYIGFGSMPGSDGGGLTEIVLDALNRAGQRGILHTGWGALQDVPRSELVLPVGSVPHEWLFPRMAAVVHHGGAGTTGAALRAGIPSLVIPFAADQPFWGRRTAALGVGPQPIARKRLTAERLAEAIRAAVNDTGMRQKAAALGSQIQVEDGIARAVELFEERFVGARPTPKAATVTTAHVNISTWRGQSAHAVHYGPTYHAKPVQQPTNNE